MTVRKRVASLTLILLVFSLSLAVAKKKPQVPKFVLDAHTVCVIIDPDAGTSLSDPLGNKTAQDEVEKALMKWGRFQLVQEPGRADLVIVIRKGANKPVDRTIGNLPTNDRPVTVQQTDNAIRIGGQQGRAPGSPSQTMPQDTRTEQQTEVGTAVAEDSFIVYGPGIATDESSGSDRTFPAGRNVGYRLMGKNLLKSPEIQAVSDFHKAIDETEKQNQQNQKKP